jgi:type I restriction enzyme S subunit
LSSDVGVRLIDDGLVYLSEEKAEEFKRSEARLGDLIFTCWGTIDQVGLIDDRARYDRYIVSNKQMFLRPDRAKADSLFLYYLFSSPEMRARIVSTGIGSSVPGFNLGQLRSMDIALPPVVTQRAIASILGALDDKIESNRQMNRTREAMARAIFHSWFVDFDPVRTKAQGGKPEGLAPALAALFPDRFEGSPLGPVPAGWRVGMLGEVCEKPQYGFTASASDEPTGPRFLRITDINKHDWIEWENVPFCGIDGDDQRKYALELGDVVIARIADPGHAALIEEDVNAIFASYLIRFRPKAANLRRYLQYWLRSTAYWQLVSSRQSGTTRGNLNAQVLAAFTLLFPTNEVLEAFTHVVQPLRNDLVAKVRQSHTLAVMRDALLPKLISGDLRVPDAERIVGRAI